MEKHKFLALAMALLFSSLLRTADPAEAQTGRTCEEDLRDASAKCYRGHCGETLPLYDSLVDKKASCPEDLRSEVYYGRGRAREAIQDFMGAVADFDAALRMKPDSTKYSEALGRAYYLSGNQRDRLGNLKGAMEDYKKALQYAPDSREAAEGLAGIYYERGLDRQKRGDLKGAMEEFVQALKLRPNFPDAVEAKRNLTERLRHKATERDAMFTF